MYTEWVVQSSGVLGGGGQPTPKILAVLFLSENLCPKLQNLEREIPTVLEFMAKIKVLCTHISSVGNLQPSVRKLKLLAPPHFLPTTLLGERRLFPFLLTVRSQED